MFGDRNRRFDLLLILEIERPEIVADAVQVQIGPKSGIGRPVRRIGFQAQIAAAFTAADEQEVETAVPVPEHLL